MESLAESETPLEITEVSNGSIFFNMLAMTENSRSNETDLRVDTNSSETPPPSTPDIRQLTIATGPGRFLEAVMAEKEGGKGRMRRWWE